MLTYRCCCKFWVLGLLIGFVFLSGCTINNFDRSSKIERSASEFEGVGSWWGKKLASDKVRPDSQLNEDFIKELYSSNRIDYFNIHPELKEAFKKGFRIGYQDRIADLVLGPHIREAAGRVGRNTSNHMVQSIEEFDSGWEQTLNRAIDVFVVLISEGSQADRDLFIKSFNDKYTEKYAAIQNKQSPANREIHMTEGGTRYILPTDLIALRMPSPETITKRFYSQSFVAMGDEWGRRYGTNLVKRYELVDMLRRCKPALDEGERLDKNINYVFTAFSRSYGADSKEVFQGIMKEAGFKDDYINRVTEGKGSHGKI